MCCGVSIQRRLQIERIHGHHFDRSRAMRLHRHENHRRNPSVNRKRQLLDQFLVREHLVLAGRQGSINAFQQKWMNEVDCFRFVRVVIRIVTLKRTRGRRNRAIKRRFARVGLSDFCDPAVAILVLV